MADVRRATSGVPGENRKLAKTALEEELLGQTARVEFWIDDDGRLVRIRVHIPPDRTYSHTDPNGDSETLKSGPNGETSTVDYSDFGVDVDATPPPKDQIAELSDLGG